jgi:hypothetical protein
MTRHPETDFISELCPTSCATSRQDAIGRHLPAEQFEVLKAAEQSKREIIAAS